LDQMLFWTTADLENKLLDFRTYFNNHRTHTSRVGRTPVTPVSRPIANLRSFRWQPHCRSLYQQGPPLRGGYLSLKLSQSSTAGRCRVGSEAQRGPAAKAVLSLERSCPSISMAPALAIV
jgi:hypothetical protein